MPTQLTSSSSFRWRSWLGLGVALFLFYGALNALSAIIVPTALHTGGAGAAGNTLVLNEKADTALLGRSLTHVQEADPRLGAFLVTFMDTMCAQMMAYAILQLSVTWFALRRGQKWALWASVIATLASFAYNVPIIQTYARFIAVPSDTWFFMILFGTIVVTAAVFSWLGLRQQSSSAPTAA
jgi:hypothetical protein